MESLLQDLKFAVRLLFKEKGLLHHHHHRAHACALHRGQYGNLQA